MIPRGVKRHLFGKARGRRRRLAIRWLRRLAERYREWERTRMITAEDENLLLAILHEADPWKMTARMRDYYADADRADRTPRSYLYLHLGMLCGTIDRMVRVPSGNQGSTS